MKSFKAQKNVKLSKFLLDSYNGGLSFSMFNKLLRKKDIKVNGERVNKDITLNIGDEVVVYYDGEQVKVTYKTIYKDENILVVSKPKGITSEDFYNQINDGNLYFCHRLDRNTDGLMIFAYNERAYEELLKGFKDRTFNKIYRAKVYGKMEKNEDLLQAYLFKDSKKSLSLIYDNKVKGSVLIKTYYKVIESHDNYSILSVELLTGRTHQIRAHLAHIGHFILGDGKYGNDKINREFGEKELNLTAQKLTLHFEKGSFLAYLDGKTFVLDWFLL